MKFQTKPLNIFHHTLSMFPHYLGKVEEFEFIANISVCRHIEARLHRSRLRRPERKDQRRILPITCSCQSSCKPW